MRRTKPSRLSAELIKTCTKALRNILIDPSTRVFHVGVDKITTTRFDSSKKKTCYIVRVTTNNACLVRGDVDILKGSYKERVEGILDFLARSADSDSEVHLEIVGPNPPTVEKVVPIRKLVQFGRVERHSPIVSTATTYQIPYALLRGRHLVGPNPAIAGVVSQIVTNSQQKIEQVLDLFAGTGVAAKVVCRAGTPRRVVIVENDASKISRMRNHIRDVRVKFVLADARRLKLREHFDLVIADPYYEDVPDFLRYQGTQIARRARIFLLVSGRVENLGWNRYISATLNEVGFRIKKHVAFGQLILECQT